MANQEEKMEVGDMGVSKSILEWHIKELQVGKKKTVLLTDIGEVMAQQEM